jgi:hypothetical protein
MVMDMLDAREKNRLLHSLQGLMERLSAPDLTVAEANDLRPKLFGLLRSLENGGNDTPGAKTGRSPESCLTA